MHSKKYIIFKKSRAKICSKYYFLGSKGCIVEKQLAHLLAFLFDALGLVLASSN